ncbi:hypothetical protein WOC76_11130 [Methylocystis sp. IM3]|uniref:hypothetical protein n=1 Tax=unclassified Methylocystis TaxID=2625913 RepID=UPI0030F83032
MDVEIRIIGDSREGAKGDLLYICEQMGLEPPSHVEVEQVSPFTWITAGVGSTRPLPKQ